MNGVGLQRDAEIIQSILTEHEIQIVEHDKPIPDADLHIFLEKVGARVRDLKGKKILIPNPEWFFPYWKKRLKYFDAVFCKTHHAVEIFKPLHLNVRYCGFTSVDRMDESVGRCESICHFPGKSKLKGTKILNGLPGLYYVPAYQNEDKFINRFNTFSIHLCPSNAEGWGHYIWEAFSVGAYVITTDAPPMNEGEFVGAKVPCVKWRTHGIAPTWKVNESALAEAIASVTPELIASARWVNRALFLRNDAEFRTRFLQMINEI